jgi:hypothetical protein
MAAADQIVFRYPRDRIRDSSALTVIARFRDRATDADVIPTSVQYRIDCLNNCVEVKDWTAVSAAEEVSIATTPDDNECITRHEVQRNMLTVAADFGLATQFVDCIEYSIDNLGLRSRG